MKSKQSNHVASTWFHYFGQDQALVAWPERFRSVLGAFIGLGVTVVVGKWLGEWVGINEWLMASLGASALLIFVLPSSPMAQPWAVIAGNVVSALVGIICATYINDVLLALPIAVALAIMAMFILRCLHPPAAAVALIAILGHVTVYRYAFFPVMLDSIVMCLVASFYNTLTGKVYPTRPPKPELKNKAAQMSRVQAEVQLDAILAEYQEVMDVDRAELIEIIQAGSKLGNKNSV